MEFTVEEMNLMCIYDTSSRTGLIRQLRGVLPEVEDAEMAELVERVAGRLERMTDAAFAALELDMAEDMAETEV